MKDQVNNIERKIDTLYDAFIGSELQPNGYIKRLEKIEKHQETFYFKNETIKIYIKKALDKWLK